MTNDDSELNPNHYTSLASAAKMYDVSTSTLRRYWQKGEFPEPIILFSKNYFKNSDLIEFNKSINNEPA